MAEKTRKVPENTPGATTSITRVSTATSAASRLRPISSGRTPRAHSYVAHQPADPAEEAACLAALEECPVEAIGNDGAMTSLPDDHPFAEGGTARRAGMSRINRGPCEYSLPYGRGSGRWGQCNGRLSHRDDQPGLFGNPIAADDRRMGGQVVLHEAKAELHLIGLDVEQVAGPETPERCSTATSSPRVS